MSTWPWIALYAITYVTGTERCELKMLEVRRGNIVAVAMSRDGSVLLAGRGGLWSPSVVVFQGDRQLSWEIRGVQPQRIVGIDASGTILGSYIAKVRTGTVERAFLFREGQVKLIPFGMEGQAVTLSFEPAGIGSDGEVFGGCNGDLTEIDATPARSAAAVWNGGLQVVGYDQFFGAFAGAVARTERGILGHVPRWLSRTHRGSSASGHLPVLFSGNGQARAPFYLPLPQGIATATPVFANPSGSLMLAQGSGSAGPSTSVIWWHDQPMTPKMPKNATAPALVSGTEDAKLAVGTMSVKGTRVAAVWEADKGMRSLEEYAREKGVLLPIGWRLIDAIGISPDGKQVFGSASNRQGLVRPYLLWLDKRPRQASK
jgi:hypothetical protein